MAKSISKEIVNPFTNGVNYEEFLEALGTANINEYLKNICSLEQIEWLVNDLEIYKKNKK